MKIKKVCICVFVCVFTMISVCAIAQAQNINQTIATKAEFADVLIRVLGITLPEGSEKLSPEELYEVQANILAERNLDIFIDSNPSDIVTRGDLAAVIYVALTDDASAKEQDMVNYMSGLGYISPGDAGDTMSFDAIITTINIPELVPVFALAYSPPGGQGGMQAPSRANPKPEDPASQV